VVYDFMGINFIAKERVALTSSNATWFNIGIMRKWWKPVLFSFGIVAAGLIATNPSFVLPYKYYFANSSPTTSMSEQTAILEDLTQITVLPDGITTGEGTAVETQPEPTAPGNEAQAAITKSQAPTVWVAGSLSIPSLNIAAPLIYVSQRTEKTFQLGLQQGVVQYPGTALPGQLGNMYVFGHSSDYRWAKGSYKTVFAKLPNIKLGSEIKVTDGAGKLYTYQVIDTAIALPNETQYLSQGNYQKKLLTVQTSYPVGTALKRFLAIAELKEN
jgi:LPXTG-site transpeptidase (sortase) family protein